MKFFESSHSANSILPKREEDESSVVTFSVRLSLKRNEGHVEEHEKSPNFPSIASPFKI